MIISRDRIRIRFDSQDETDAVDVITGLLPRGTRGTDLQFELAFSFEGTLVTPSNFATIEIVVKPDEDRDALAPLLSKTVGAAEINSLLTEEDWTAGTAQHVIVPFTNAETVLDLGKATEKKFFMSAVGITTDTPARVIPLGSSKFIMESNGRSGLALTAPLGSSVIAAGTNYSGGGTYVPTTVSGRLYYWIKGANDTSITNGTETLTVSGYIYDTGAGLTLAGTASALITALLRWPLVYTAEQVDAKLAGLLRIINAPGVNVGMVSENGLYLRLSGVTNERMPFDKIVDLGV